MSRYYRVFVEVKGITKEQMNDVMKVEFGWEEEDIDEWKEVTMFTGTGSLCGGQSEEEAHKQIYDFIKKINPKAKIRTSWTYLEDLPCESYGDDLE